MLFWQKKWSYLFQKMLNTQSTSYAGPVTKNKLPVNFNSALDTSFNSLKEYFHNIKEIRLTLRNFFLKNWHKGDIYSYTYRIIRKTKQITSFELVQKRRSIILTFLICISRHFHCLLSFPFVWLLWYILFSRGCTGNKTFPFFKLSLLPYYFIVLVIFVFSYFCMTIK